MRVCCARITLKGTWPLTWQMEMMRIGFKPCLVQWKRITADHMLLYMVLPKKLKRTVSRTFAYCKTTQENSNLTGMHSCEGRLNCNRQAHSERQQTIEEALSLSLAMFRCWGTEGEMTPRIRRGILAEVSTC